MRTAFHISRKDAKAQRGGGRWHIGWWNDQVELNESESAVRIGPKNLCLENQGGDMKTLHFRQRSGRDGSLHLAIPVGKPDAECEVVVVVEPNGPCEWLPGFWERMAQGWQGEPLERPDQGICQIRDPLR